MLKEKLEKDFQEFNSQIENMADEEIKAIAEKISRIKAEVTKVGESMTSSESENREAGKEKG